MIALTSSIASTVSSDSTNPNTFAIKQNTPLQKVALVLLNLIGSYLPYQDFSRYRWTLLKDPKTRVDWSDWLLKHPNFSLEKTLTIERLPDIIVSSHNGQGMRIAQPSPDLEESNQRLAALRSAPVPISLTLIGNTNSENFSYLKEMHQLRHLTIMRNSTLDTVIQSNPLTSTSFPVLRSANFFIYANYDQFLQALMSRLEQLTIGTRSNTFQFSLLSGASKLTSLTLNPSIKHLSLDIITNCFQCIPSLTYLKYTGGLFSNYDRDLPSMPNVFRKLEELAKTRSSCFTIDFPQLEKDSIYCGLVEVIERFSSSPYLKFILVNKNK